MTDYYELKAIAFKNPTFETISALVEWLSEHDPRAWNGEIWRLENGESIRPIYREIDEDTFETIDYEIT